MLYYVILWKMYIFVCKEKEDGGKRSFWEKLIYIYYFLDNFVVGCGFLVFGFDFRWSFIWLRDEVGFLLIWFEILLDFFIIE